MSSFSNEVDGKKPTSKRRAALKEALEHVSVLRANGGDSKSTVHVSPWTAKQVVTAATFESSK